MPQYESITNAGEFISDHFLTTDETKGSFLKQVRDLRKSWNEAAKEGESTTHSRFTAVRADLARRLAAATEAGPERIAETYAQLREVLGFPGDTTSITTLRSGTELTIEGVWTETGTEPGTETGNPETIWLQATPADTVDDAVATSTTLHPVYEDQKPLDRTLGSLISDIFLSENPPAYIVASAGRFLILAERERWPEGRYLAADALLVAERNETKQGGEIDYLLAIFGRDSLRPAADGSIWWNTVLEEAVSHAVSVSKDLRVGVRRSIEIIANDVLAQRRRAGLESPSQGVDGNELARQSLRYLYRILFLLFAEASPELDVLPVGAAEYDAGYGLERLRELIQNDLTTPQAQTGTHFYDSLDLLFQLVNGSHPSQKRGITRNDDGAADYRTGLAFQPLEADLFHPSRTSLINQYKLSNEALQEVLTRLLLSSEKRGTQRGFVSYANLGINQLGAVYEGLMSYSGFIASEDLYEVAPNGNPEKGSWVVPVSRWDEELAAHLVTVTEEDTGAEHPVQHRAGAFVFRLAGRERQQSASYYTPEVLTRFVVSQALGELLDQNTTEENTHHDDAVPTRTSAEEILNLSICEPALGSGAFAIEAVRQLADEYLKRRQEELGEQIPAENYAVELQKVKAQIALHQVHGVDLNATAVELAEVSLWLDTMSAGLQAPWFGLRLKRGNSLVGARRATYSVKAAERKDYLSEEPLEHSLTGMVEAMERGGIDPAAEGRIHHFLLPGEDWGAAADAKEVKALAGENQKKLKAWRKTIRSKLTKKQLERMVDLSHRVEALWPIALRRLQVAESEARREIKYFGKQEESLGAGAVTREEIERKLGDPDGIFQRFKRVMDAWNALWFWPVVPDTPEGEEGQSEAGQSQSSTAQPIPPDIDVWLDGLQAILGVHGQQPAPRYRSEGQTSILAEADWSDLDAAEDLERGMFGMHRIHRVLDEHPWLVRCEQIASDQGFFHWELEFGTVFAEGGFDLQVGNPPWVRPDWDEKAVYAEHDPWWQLASKPSQGEKNRRSELARADAEQAEFMCDSARDITGLRSVLSADSQHPMLAGLRPDLYRSFMVQTWRSAHRAGSVALIHPESHFTEKKAGRLRSETYRRLRRHWQFINELSLFEIHHLVSYGVHVYGSRNEEPKFLMAASLYHPETAERSLRHQGGGEVPGLKDGDGNWDTRPHGERILTVTSNVLETWASILEDVETPALEARMIYPVNRASESVLEKLAPAPRIHELNLQYSRGWDEAAARRQGYFEVGSAVNDSWEDVIFQGPHFSVANLFAKQPNETMRNNLDWSELDLEALPFNFVPRTSYQPTGGDCYNKDYGNWTAPNGADVPIRKFHRLAIREYVGSVTGARTLQPALIPPGTAHVNVVNAYGLPVKDSLNTLGYLGGLWSSIVLDFLTRIRGQGHIYVESVLSLPHPGQAELMDLLAARFLALSPPLPSGMDNFERNALNRYLLLTELDALSAIGFGLTADELCTIYRTQFPVLRGYEQKDLYDANGRQVPKEMNKLYRKVGESGMEPKDLLWTHPQSQVEYRYEFPFRSFDREADMRAAYTRFQFEIT